LHQRHFTALEIEITADVNPLVVGSLIGGFSVLIGFGLPRPHGAMLLPYIETVANLPSRVIETDARG
jgi:hypothetical protein